MKTETLETPKTKAQKKFESAVKKLERMYGLSSSSLCRYYHDEESVSVDGELHSILNFNSEFCGEGREVIDDALASIGYYIENIDGCDFKFYKV